MSAHGYTPPLSDASPTALDLLQVGLLGCFLAVLPGEMLAFDRHLLGKETILHLAAFGAATAMIAGRGMRRPGREAILLAVFAAASLAGAFAAYNVDLSMRSAAVTISFALVFVVARTLARDGHSGALLVAAAAATAVAAATALLESQGLLEGLSYQGRGPGGVVGNRNRMAHLAVLAMPAAAVVWVEARRAPLRLAAGTCAVLFGAVILLSRSRGAWLAVGTITVLAVAWTTVVGGRLDVRRRLAGYAMLAACGAALALIVPNRLAWQSATPHADTLRSLVDHRAGSGRGRLIQYRNTLAMIAEHPVRGVGPGHWMVEYPRYRSADDPSYDPDELFPTTLYPQGDWIGIAAERGIPTLLMLVLVAAGIAVGAARRAVRPEAADDAVRGACALATLLAVTLLGIFDPLVVTPLGAFLVAVVLGALSVPLAHTAPAEAPVRSTATRRVAFAVVAIVGVAVVGESARRAVGAVLYGRTAEPGALEQALRLDGSDYRARIYLAQRWTDAGRCDLARPHLDAARELIPTFPAPDVLARACPSADVVTANSSPDSGGAPPLP